MDYIATICATLFVICAIMSIIDRNWIALAGWMCAFLWVLNWFAKV